jgi:carboxyl-terminal processing protease
MNGNSASASEVFMGAVRDYGAGKLVGTKSFGKGIVQSIFDLKDGTAVKFTTSEYFSPNGNNIHGTGFEPDVEVELDEELKTLISIPKEKDNQLQKAIEVLKEEL